MKFYYVNGNAPTNQKNVFNEGINPKEIMCPKTCQFIELSDKLKSKMDKEKYFNFTDDKVPDFWYYDMDRMIDFSQEFKLLYKAQNGQPHNLKSINTVKYELKLFTPVAYL